MLGERYLLSERTQLAPNDLPTEIVYAGIWLGIMNAQRFARTRLGAQEVLLYEACDPITGEWACGPWPDEPPVQVHGTDNDEFFANEGDLDAALELIDSTGPGVGAASTYPGNRHLFPVPEGRV